MVEVTPRKGEAHLQLIDSLVRVHKIGGIITFQGTTEETKTAINRFQSQRIWLLRAGLDGEWGSSTRISEHARCPYQLALTAANTCHSTDCMAQAMGVDRS